jgi:hypothetical protein
MRNPIKPFTPSLVTLKNAFFKYLTGEILAPATLTFFNRKDIIVVIDKLNVGIRSDDRNNFDHLRNIKDALMLT